MFNAMLVLRNLSFLFISAALVGPSGAVPTVIEERDTTVTWLDSYDYVIVGSGAGGGPLAAKLAINGNKVLVLEAGDDQGTSIQESIPAFFPAASEYAPMAWDYFVRHYPDDAREAKNSKATYTTPSGETYIGLNPPPGSTLKGIWYPRAGTLGGCAAHNALITVSPHDRDWALIQTLTGDSSWAPENMRQYFKRLERNQYLTDFTDSSAAGHGFDGWLGTNEMDLELLANDPKILSMLTAAKSVVKGTSVENITDVASLHRAFPLDMNSDDPNRDSTEDLYQVPMAVLDGKRSSPRELLVATANAKNADGSKKYRLDIRLNTLVTKIRFSGKAGKGSTPRAVGVDFLDGQSLYRADPRAGTAGPGRAGSVNATREVIISAGTFNTPQLLKLSGIGPMGELQKFNIPVVVNLQGVGARLQDRYEISTVVKYDTDFDFFKGCTFLAPGTNDACFAQYTSGSNQKGPYATNLISGAVLKKSSVAESTRDLFIFGGPIAFRGYFQGYTNYALADWKHWTWITLKSHEKNVAGSVTLKSSDPQDMPAINFNYFAGGTDQVDDLQALMDGVVFSRSVYANISAPYKGHFVEEYPGSSTSTAEQLKQFVKDEAWGHHASSTAQIGPDTDPFAVLDSRFRVRGVSGLRVVDASVFPRVPGFFPVLSVYMISEKAADVIMADNA